MTERRGYASPPCFLHEVDPAYSGFLNNEEIVALLNTLLEAERAGARGVSAMSRDAPTPALQALLTSVAGDEAGFCGMLTRNIKRLGGRPSRVTGNFYGKLLARETLAEQLDLLDRGQSWVVRELQSNLPKIEDETLHDDLKVMLDVHERNIARCRIPEAES